MSKHPIAASNESDLHESGNERVIEGQKLAMELAVAGAPLPEILEVLVRTVEEQSSREVLGSILLLDPETKRLHKGAAPSLPDAYNAAIEGLLIGDGVGSCGTAAFRGETVVVRDISTDPYWAAFKDLAKGHGLAACWSTPIFSSKREILGTFALYHHEPATPSDRDCEIVDLLSHTAALLIERDTHIARTAAVTEELRKEREEQMTRLQAMFEHAPVSIASLHGPEHIFDVANQGYKKLVGDRPLLGKTVREAFPELADQGFYELLDTVRNTGKPYIGHAQRVLLRRGPGQELDEAFVDFVYQPVPNDIILVAAFEVTGLMRAKLEAEAALTRAKASEHALRTFIDNLPELAWTAGPDGSIDYYNSRWYEYTGTTSETMQAYGWEPLHDPDLLPKVVERWTHSLETGEPFEMEFTLRGADGVYRWFLTRVAAVRDESGNILRWIGTNTNIDQIKSVQALTEAMAVQSRDVQRAMLELRSQKEAAEKRIQELESKQALADE